MMAEPTGPTRYVGIIADGPTDHEVLAKLATCLLERAGNVTSVIELGGKLRDPVDRFWKGCDQSDGHSLFAEPAKTLVDAAVTVLMSALSELEGRVKRYDGLRSHDLLMMSTDAERLLARSAAYFDPWATVVRQALDLAVERFYDRMLGQGYEAGGLPMVLPFVPFPSTDVLVVAARGEAFDPRGEKASDIKAKLYGVANLSLLAQDDFKTKALDHITPEGCAFACKRVPEARRLIHSMMWCSATE